MALNLLLRWSNRLPVRVIEHPEGSPYLERYHVFSRFGVTCYLHRFVASDPDRGLHSHPWPWACSIKLSGWYYEERPSPHPDGPNLIRVPRRVHWLSGSSFHRVVLPTDADCWTLFIHRAKRSQWWGFLNRTGNTFEYRPFRYPEDRADHGAWWRYAPKGRDIR